MSDDLFNRTQQLLTSEPHLFYVVQVDWGSDSAWSSLSQSYRTFRPNVNHSQTCGLRMHTFRWSKSPPARTPRVSPRHCSHRLCVLLGHSIRPRRYKYLREFVLGPSRHWQIVFFHQVAVPSSAQCRSDGHLWWNIPSFWPRIPRHHRRSTFLRSAFHGSMSQHNAPIWTSRIRIVLRNCNLSRKQV